MLTRKIVWQKLITLRSVGGKDSYKGRGIAGILYRFGKGKVRDDSVNHV